MKRKLRLLLVNPWIHDFAAYDLFYRPLGLLSLGESLNAGPAHITVLDLLDRFNPRWHDMCPHDRDTDAGTGPFYREIIQKPEIIGHVPRYFSRYGAPKPKVEEILACMDAPDAIMLTSHMTYWYTGVRETAETLRAAFPGVPLILGGIWATLMPEHAQKEIHPDLLVTGSDLSPLGDWLYRRFGLRFSMPEITDFPHIRDHYPVLKHYPLLTSRGCPYHCSFCAGPILNPVFRQIPADNIIRQIRTAADFVNRRFVFYDDALFIHAKSHIKPILRAAGESGGLSIYTPNGLFARFLDRELAELMACARFMNPVLSLETVIPEHRETISNKVNREQYADAVKNLHAAGYRPNEITTYVIMGLPGQTPEQVRMTIKFAFETGSRVSLAAFSPIPKTALFKSAGIDPAADPLLLNNTVYSAVNSEYGEIWQNIRLEVKAMNEKIKQDAL